MQDAGRAARKNNRAAPFQLRSGKLHLRGIFGTELCFLCAEMFYLFLTWLSGSPGLFSPRAGLSNWISVGKTKNCSGVILREMGPFAAAILVAFLGKKLYLLLFIWRNKCPPPVCANICAHGSAGGAIITKNRAACYSAPTRPQRSIKACPEAAAEMKALGELRATYSILSGQQRIPVDLIHLLPVTEEGSSWQRLQTSRGWDKKDASAGPLLL